MDNIRCSTKHQVYQLHENNDPVFLGVKQAAMVSSVPTYWLDHEGLIVGMNTAFATLVGIQDITHFFGKLIDSFYSPETIKGAHQKHQQVLALGKSVTYQNIIENITTKKKFSIHAMASPLYSQNHQVVGLIDIVIGATEKKITTAKADVVTQKKFQQLEQIARTLPVPFYWLDREQYYLGVNDYVIKGAGRISYENDFAGKTPYEIYPKKMARSIIEHHKDVIKYDQIFSGEETVRDITTGEIRHVKATVAPLYNSEGDIIGTYGISVDITAERKAERLQRDKIIAEKTISTLKAIAGSLAHELKTPLAGIRIGLQNIKQFFGELFEERNQLSKLPSVSEKLVCTSEDIQEQARYINKLTDKIDEGSRIISLQLRNLTLEHIDTSAFKSCDMVDCINDAIDKFPFKYSNERDLIHININKHFSFFGDPLLTQHVLWNILNNAFHYIRAESKGRISITVDTLNDRFVVQIKDTAKGMSPEVSAKIFDQFYTKRRDGTGLGLSFCKMVMEAYGGDITCQAEEGKYAEFILTFPKLSERNK